MNRRESTNVKLTAIIHAKNNDQEEEKAVIDEENKAKIRLRRTSLYNGGARTKIPKIKRKKSTVGKSPFKMVGGAPDDPNPIVYDHSVPPGAHSGQYLMVSNNTRRSMEDPDRVCINSTSMLPGIRVVAQPPWYFGSNNKIEPPDTSYVISAARYGFRGSKGIEQYLTKPYEAPSKTFTERVPKFLSPRDDFVDEWVPPIMASSVLSINGIETPKLWPENTEFVTGYSLKKDPKSWRYKRETTVDRLERPQSSEDLKKVRAKTQDNRNTLLKFAKMESSNSFKSLPMAAQTKFLDSWRSEVELNANNTLKHTLAHKGSGKAKHGPPHTLMDPSDAIRYSGTTAMIVHTQSTEELKFRIRMERSKAKSTTPYEVKWQHVIVHYNNINNKLKKKEIFAQAVNNIARILQRAAINCGSETSLQRIDFVKACGRIDYFDEVTPKQLSLLYSIFDPMKKNNMRFVEIIVALSIFDKPTQDSLEKLQHLWILYHEFGLDRNIFDIALDLLSSCSSSVGDSQQIDDLFRKEFRLACYECSLREEAASSSPGSPERGSKTVSFSPSGVSPVHSRPRSRENKAENFGGMKGSGDPTLGETRLSRKKTMSLPPQYNICEQYLNEHTLPKVLRKCPELMAAFNEQLSARLVACYGSDDRLNVPEEEPVGTEDLDFSWILKKPPPKRAVFTLH